MKNGWRLIKLGELCELNYGKALVAKARNFGNVPVYSSAGVIGVHNVPICETEGIIIGRKGSVGTVYYSPVPFFCIDTAFYIKPSEKYDLRFLYYLLTTLNLNKLNSDSAVPGLNRDNAYSQIFYLPPILKQKEISIFLSELDNKIELNEKINQNLEAQAQAIFKSWFVDFEPFGGKMPADWGQGCLSDVLSVIESGSRPKGGSESSGVPSIGAENIDGIGHYDYSKEKYINRDFFQNLRHGKVNSGDILLYKDGAYVGKVSMALNGFPHEICAVNEHVFILRTNERLPSQSYLYLFFAQHSIRNKIATLGSAKAAQPGVNQSDIKGIALTIPNKRTIQAFENIASSLFSKIVQNSIQSRRLSQLRDTLLPKLMSGEIDVSDVAV